MAPGQSVLKQEGDKKLLVIDYRGLPYGPDIAQYPQAMKDVIDKLQEVDVDEVVLAEYYERIYNEKQTRLLKGIADAISRFEADAVWSPNHLGKTTDSKQLASRHDSVLTVLNTLHSDPFKAYLFLVQEIKTVSARVANAAGAESEDLTVYAGTLQYIRKHLEETELVRQMKAYLQQLGKISADRTVYRAIFESAIKPSFIGSRIFFTSTEELELVDQYDVVGSRVYIYKHPDKVEYLYFINPPEYSLPPEKYFLLEKTKEVVSQHRPETVEFMNITQARKYFNKVYVATISDLALKNGIRLTVEEKEELATIVARYTIGYGIMEVLLSDRRLTDVYIDSPLGEKPIYLVHSKYGQCQTNVIFSDEEARAIVSRFRALSGRPFDEAHPILDFDLQDLQTRVAVIGKPLALDGIAFAFRLHKETPWTLAQFVDNHMFDATSAGILSFFVDAQASMLVVGSRGSGKTSMLQSMMLEIPQNLRIIVQEDSVTPDSRILVEQDGVLKHSTIGKLVDSLMSTYGFDDLNGKDVLQTNPDGVKVHALHPDGKIRLSNVTQFTRHKVNKPIYEVFTRSGRRIKVTQDHSLFTLADSGEISPVKPTGLIKGSFIAVPSNLSFDVVDPVKEFDALPALLGNNTGYLVSPKLKAWIRENFVKVKKAAKMLGYSKSIPSHWRRAGILPINVMNCLSEVTLPFKNELFFKLDETSTPLPVLLTADLNLLRLAGLWLADGCYDGKYGVVLSVNEDDENALVTRVAEKLGLNVRFHSDGFSKIISNTNLVWFFKNMLGLKGDAYDKEFPSWAFNLSREQRAALIQGLFTGDGYVAKNEVTYSTCSKELVKQLELLLLSFNIFSRIKYLPRDKTYRLAISDLNYIRKFKEIGFILGRKNASLERLCSKNKTHDSGNVIPLSLPVKAVLSQELNFNKHDYLTRDFAFGRAKLGNLLAASNSSSNLQSYLSLLVNSDVYWDQVVSVDLVDVHETFVYDFSVPKANNFVCENVIAHNTQEIPVMTMKRLGFNVQRLKTRPPLGGGAETEVSAEDALRTALRLGDSVLIVGEVRSTEAKALYEAMRVGAVGNVVMGTIHGESAYSIWDRVVNDLGVPTTSFKATDFAVVSAPIRFKGSLARHRRLIELTEVLKHWNNDPHAENGFLNWEEFDAGKDALTLVEENLRKSEWIGKVQRMRGLSFEDLWAEVLGRSASKQYLVDVKRKHEIPKLLEADYSVRAHSKYLLLSEKQREEFGSVDHDELLADWKKWVNEELVKDLLNAKAE